jgi:hypothetical protein
MAQSGNAAEGADVRHAEDQRRHADGQDDSRPDPKRPTDKQGKRMVIILPAAARRVARRAARTVAGLHHNTLPSAWK